MSTPPHDALSPSSARAIAPPSGLMALAFTDLEGSSALSERLGGDFETLRDAHFEILRVALENHGGYEVETAGDSLFAVFGAIGDAAAWAVAAQRAMESHDWPPHAGVLRVRVGIHVGAPFVNRDKKTGALTFRGPVTNRTARVMSAAHGGQIVLSEAARELLRPFPAAFSCLDLGVHRLKGIGDERLWQLSAPDLCAQFPPLNTLSTRRHNLPLPPTPFIGPEDEIAAWRALLLEPKTRLLTLCGFGGLGKTRLALQLGENCVADFAEGVWWVALEEARSEGAMLAQIAASLPFQVQNEATTPLETQIVEFLSEKSVLLVLDNTEQIAAAPRVVRALLGAPGLKILVTTRHALGLRSEILRHVAPLAPDDAARLFCDKAAALGHEFEMDSAQIRAIVARLEGVPLALELCASLTSVLGLSQITARLGDQLKLLRSRTPDLPDRQRALRATMDWSHEMLDADERALFAQLAIFAGGCTLDDAEALCDAPDVFFSIQELHRRSLLRAVEGDVTRYAMLESVRSYALEQLAASGDAERVGAAHARHFGRKFSEFAAQIRGAGEARALHAARDDFFNARAALRFLATLGETARAQRAALALDFGRVLQRCGAWIEAGERLSDGLQALENAGDEFATLRAHLEIERAGTHFDVCEWDAARALATRALRVFEKSAEARGQAEAHNLLGLIALHDGNESAENRATSEQIKSETAARAHFEMAIALSEGTARAMALSNLGLWAHAQGDAALAQRHFENALALYRAHNYERGAAESLTNLGVLAQERADLQAAHSAYRAAFELELHSGVTPGVARSLSNLGEIALALGAPEKAAPIFAAAARIFQSAGSPHRHYCFGMLESACALLQRSPHALLAATRDPLADDLVPLAL